MMDQIKAAFVAMTGVPDAWTNPALMQARNGFIQGWEAGSAYEREACAKVCDGLYNGSIEEFGALVGEIYNEDCAAAIRARGINEDHK